MKGKRRNPGEHHCRKREQMPARMWREATKRYGCTKLAYRDKAAAKVRLRELQGIRRRQGHGDEPHERSVYRCPQCDLWHLTSRKKHAGWGNARRRVQQAQQDAP